MMEKIIHKVIIMKLVMMNLIIIEDIDKDKGDRNDESKKNFGNSSKNIGSLRFDSSVTDFNEKNFDYVEDVDKA